ncbi:MAG: hypothetical protein V6Z78_01190 [Holosporaceae bacterium]
MKNTIFYTCLLLCLGSMPLWAPKKEDQTQESPKLVAAAANPSASQTATSAVAKSVPRKAMMPPSEPFCLDAETCKILQSTVPADAEAKEDLLADAARAVALYVSDLTFLSGDTKKLMALFANVRSFEMSPYIGECLSDAEQLESVFGQLKNLRKLSCESLLTLDGSDPAQVNLFARIVKNNPRIEDFQCASAVTEEVVRMLGRLPLRELHMVDCGIDDAKFELFPFDTLELLVLRGVNSTLSKLPPLQNSGLYGFSLYSGNGSNDTWYLVICSMQHLVKLLKREPQMRELNLNANLNSDTMFQKLYDVFGDKVLFYPKT